MRGEREKRREEKRREREREREREKERERYEARNISAYIRIVEQGKGRRSTTTRALGCA